MLRVAAMIAAVLAAPVADAAWHFSDVTAEAGLTYQHGYVDTSFDERSENAGGVAAGDYDRDGFVDLFVVRGDIGSKLLFRNRDGTFEDVTVASGLVLPPDREVVGATAPDYDRDGDLDLFLTHWSASYFNLLDTSSMRCRRSGSDPKAS